MDVSVWFHSLSKKCLVTITTVDFMMNFMMFVNKVPRDFLSLTRVDSFATVVRNLNNSVDILKTPLLKGSAVSYCDIMN